MEMSRAFRGYLTSEKTFTIVGYQIRLGKALFTEDHSLWRDVYRGIGEGLYIYFAPTPLSGIRTDSPDTFSSFNYKFL